MGVVVGGGGDAGMRIVLTRIVRGYIIGPSRIDVIRVAGQSTAKTARQPASQSDNKMPKSKMNK